MAEEFANESCGPRPLQSDFLKRNGNVKWKAYNKANTRWLKCARTALRQTAENVEARSGAAAEIGSSIADAAGTVGAAYFGAGDTDTAISGVVDMAPPKGDGNTAPPKEPGVGQYLPYAAAAAVAYLLLGK